MGSSPDLQVGDGIHEKHAGLQPQIFALKMPRGKSETRISKSEGSTKLDEDNRASPNRKFPVVAPRPISNFGFRFWDLFRVSDFVFRIFKTSSFVMNMQ